jgi:hypothetical protein
MVSTASRRAAIAAAVFDGGVLPWFGPADVTVAVDLARASRSRSSTV